MNFKPANTIQLFRIKKQFSISIFHSMQALNPEKIFFYKKNIEAIATKSIKNQELFSYLNILSLKDLRVASWCQ